MVLVRQRLGLLSISFVCAKAPFRPAQWSKVQPLQQLRRFRSTPATTPVPDPVAHPILEPATKLAAGPVETPGIVLREYQEECIQAVLQYLRKGHKRLGVSLATGSGKTVIFTQLISRIPPRNERGDKTLILVHRRELVEQAARHCRLAYPNKSVEVEMGNNAAKGSADIVVASVQSLLSKDRIFKFAPNMFKLVLVDEAHHIVAKSYRQILQYFGLNEANADSPALVGVSATFSRSDGLKLGAAIDHIVYHKDYVDMIDEKWLSNAVFTTVQSKADLSKVKKDSFGDFALGSLSEAVNTNMTNSVTVRAWMANAQGRSSTLVFCVDVEHTQSLTQTFREYGIDARYITASTPRQVRGEQLQAFKDQEFPVLLNCGLFTEGTDIPNIDCVLLARPTKSRNLLIQMIGRGLRLFPGKENCHIIDMVATLETGVISTPTLFGLHPDEVLSGSSAVEIREGIDKATKDANADATKANRTTLGPTPVTEQERANARAVEDGIKVKFTHYDTITDLVGDMRSGDRHIRTLSPYAWVRTGDDDRYVLSDRNGWITIRKGQDKDIDTSTYSDTSDTPITASNIYTVTHVLKITPFKNNNDDNDDNDLESRTRKKPFFTRPRLIAKTPDLETAVRAADTYAPNVFNEHYISTRPAWRAAPATSAQIQMLNRAKLKQKGLLRYSDLTRGQAADMITKLKFGGKSRFSAMRKVRLKREEARGKLEETIRLGMTGVQVGPVQM